MGADCQAIQLTLVESGVLVQRGTRITAEPPIAGENCYKLRGGYTVILPISFQEPGRHRIQVVWSPTKTRYSQEKKENEEIRVDPIASNTVELGVLE